MEFTFIIFLKLVITFIIVNILPGLTISFYLFRNEEGLNLIDKIILACILSPVILIIVSYFEDLIGIPQNSSTLALNLSAIALPTAYLYWKKKKEKLLKNFIDRWDILAYASFVLLLFFRVFPTTQSPVPLAADSIAHTEWLRILHTTFHATTDQWYPQGMQYFLNYYAAFVAPLYPKWILIFTNFFAALFPISFFYFGILAFSRTKKYLVLPWIFFMISSLTTWPKDLYFTLGKNATVLAFSIIPIALYLFFRLKKRLDAALLAVIMFALFIIHYPNAILMYGLGGIILLSELFSYQKKKIEFHKGAFANLLFFSIISVALLGIAVLHAFPIYQAHPASSDTSLIGAITSAQAQGGFHFFLTNYPNNLIGIFGIPSLVLFIISLIAFLRQRAPEKIITLSLIGYLFLMAIDIVLLSLPDPAPGIFYHLQFFVFFIFPFIILIAWFLEEVSRKIECSVILEKTIKNLMIFKYEYLKKITPRGITLAVLIIIFVVGGCLSFSQYIRSTKRVLTREQDLKAFAFINERLPKDGKRILIRLYSAHNRTVIHGADSGIWLNAYTGRPVEVDWVNFSKKKSFDIFNLSEQLTKESGDLESLKELYCEYGIGYAFKGSGRRGKVTQIYNSNKDHFELLYDDGAQLYKITNIDCL